MGWATPWVTLLRDSVVTDADGSVRLILTGLLSGDTLVIVVVPGSHAWSATRQTRLNRQQDLRRMWDTRAVESPRHRVIVAERGPMGYRALSSTCCDG